MHTTHAFFITLAALLGGFIWATFYPQSPYVAFSGSVALAFGGYVGKRLIQKKKEYSGFQNYSQGHTAHSEE